MRANVEILEFFARLVDDGLLEIRPDGTVMNAITLKVYNSRTTKGAVHIAWKDNKQTKHVLAHRLIYRVTKGPLGPDDQVIHLDGDRSNNRPVNLAKTDNAGSTNHAYALGLVDTNEMRNGLRNYYRNKLQVNAKLSAEQVIEIRRRFAAGETTKALAKAFHADRKAISYIVRGMAYKSVPAALTDASRSLREGE